MSLAENIFGKQYSYYDSPEGEDCMKKLGAVTRGCGFYGLILATVDVTMISHPKGYPQIFARYAYITLPIIGMGAAFTTTTCIATNLRKKDDIWNYYLGGASAGAIMGAALKSVKVGSYGAIVLGAAAALKKDLDQRGVTFFQSRLPPRSENHRVLKRDYSMFADPGKTQNS